MQVLAIVLLMICNAQNSGLSTSGTSHNKFFKDAATNLNALVNALQGIACCTVVNYVHSKVLLTQFFTLATHGDSPFVLRCM